MKTMNIQLTFNCETPRIAIELLLFHEKLMRRGDESPPNRFDLYDWRIRFAKGLEELMNFGLSIRAHNTIARASMISESRRFWDGNRWHTVETEPHIVQSHAFVGEDNPDYPLPFEQWICQVASGQLHRDILVIRNMGHKSYEELIVAARRWLEANHNDDTEANLHGDESVV